jgi:N-acetyl-gamma-glutamyl-phosphate reductase
VSGAGRQAKVDNLLTEVADSFKAYGVAGHRHLPEIEQGLADVAGEPVAVTFVPHLLPMIRGIHSTLFARLKGEAGDLQALYEQWYADEPFVGHAAPDPHGERRQSLPAGGCFTPGEGYGGGDGGHR